MRTGKTGTSSRPRPRTPQGAHNTPARASSNRRSPIAPVGLSGAGGVGAGAGAGLNSDQQTVASAVFANDPILKEMVRNQQLGRGVGLTAAGSPGAPPSLSLAESFENQQLLRHGMSPDAAPAPVSLDESFRSIASAAPAATADIFVGRDPDVGGGGGGAHHREKGAVGGAMGLHCSSLDKVDADPSTVVAKEQATGTAEGQGALCGGGRPQSYPPRLTRSQSPTVATEVFLGGAGGDTDGEADHDCGVSDITDTAVYVTNPVYQQSQTHLREGCVEGSLSCPAEDEESAQAPATGQHAYPYQARALPAVPEQSPAPTTAPTAAAAASSRGVLSLGSACNNAPDSCSVSAGGGVLDPSVLRDEELLSFIRSFVSEARSRNIAVASTGSAGAATADADSLAFAAAVAGMSLEFGHRDHRAAPASAVMGTGQDAPTVMASATFAASGLHGTSMSPTHNQNQSFSPGLSPSLSPSHLPAPNSSQPQRSASAGPQPFSSCSSAASPHLPGVLAGIAGKSASSAGSTPAPSQGMIAASTATATAAFVAAPTPATAVDIRKHVRRSRSGGSEGALRGSSPFLASASAIASASATVSTMPADAMEAEDPEVKQFMGVRGSPHPHPYLPHTSTSNPQTPSSVAVGSASWNHGCGGLAVAASGSSGSGGSGSALGGGGGSRGPSRGSGGRHPPSHCEELLDARDQNCMSCIPDTQCPPPQPVPASNGMALRAPKVKKVLGGLAGALYEGLKQQQGSIWGGGAAAAAAAAAGASAGPKAAAPASGCSVSASAGGSSDAGGGHAAPGIPPLVPPGAQVHYTTTPTPAGDARRQGAHRSAETFDLRTAYTHTQAVAQKYATHVQAEGNASSGNSVVSAFSGYGAGADSPHDLGSVTSTSTELLSRTGVLVHAQANSGSGSSVIGLNLQSRDSAFDDCSVGSHSVGSQSLRSAKKKRSPQQVQQAQQMHSQRLSTRAHR